MLLLIFLLLMLLLLLLFTCFCRILEAAECGQFSDAGFKALTEGCLSLQKLDLEECILVSCMAPFHLH